MKRMCFMTVTGDRQPSRYMKYMQPNMRHVLFTVHCVKKLVKDRERETLQRLLEILKLYKSHEVD